MDSSTLQQIPDKYRQLYQRHWNTIKTSVKQGRLKDVYHFPLVTTTNQEIVDKVQEVMANYDKVKTNIAFGFILQHRTTAELKFFHPSNNNMLFEAPRLLNSPTDYQKLIDDIEQKDAFEYARSQRPSTKWTVERIICVRIDIFKIFI